MTKNFAHAFSFIDLFAGIGGTRIAFERAGAKCVFSSEWDKHCQKTYNAFFGDVPHGDITDSAIQKLIPSFNILVAGFPCQPFSSIGQRQGFKHNTQGTLFHEIVKILNKKKPDAFLLENVKGLRTHADGNTYRIIGETLRKDYWINDTLLNAKYYGVPQKRERTYIVGFRKNLVSAHTEQDAYQKIGFSFSNLQQTKSAYIDKHLERGIKDRAISEHLQKVYIHKLEDGRPQILELNGRSQVANTLCASYHKIQRLTGIFVKDGPTGLRLLSENECRAIMGFPKIGEAHNGRVLDAVPVSRTQMYRQFGNSVAVPVIALIAREMINALSRLGVNSK